MLNEEKTYLRLCKLAEPKVKPSDFIISALKLAVEKGELDLSNKTETTLAWETIGQIISTSTNFHTLTFRDCLIPPQGFASIIRNLCQNSTVRSIDLRGNNIQTTSVAQIGKLLRHNKSIISLSLEWNSLGTYPDSFGLFCDGLAMNQTLQFLDLKNNQISGDCSPHLANVIRKNTTLKVLDLRWNTLGIRGGQQLHAAAQHNKSLHRIKLQGNNIPDELAKSVDQMARHNEADETLKSNCRVKTDFLVQHLKESEGSRQGLKKECEDKIQEIIRESKNRINKMEENLTERDSAIKQLQEQMESACVDLQTSEKKIRLLEESVIEKEMCIQEMISIKKKDFEDFQKKLSEKDAQLSTLKSEMESNLSTERKLRLAADTKLELQAKELALLEHEIQKHAEKLRLSRHEYDELLQTEHSTHQEALLRLEREHETNSMKLHNEIGFVRASLQERVRELEKEREELEKKKSELSSLLAREQSKCEECVAQALQQCRAREDARVAQLDERLQVARDERAALEKQLQAAQAGARDERAALEKQLGAAQAGAAQLQSHNAALVTELAEPQRRLAKMHEDLCAERLAAQRLRQDLSEEAAKAKARRSEADSLQGRLHEAQSRQAELVAEGREREGKLQAALAEKERELHRVRQDEADRAAALNFAFSKYLGCLNPGPLLGGQSRNHSRADMGDYRKE